MGFGALGFRVLGLRWLDFLTLAAVYRAGGMSGAAGEPADVCARDALPCGRLSWPPPRAGAPLFHTFLGEYVLKLLLLISVGP